MSLRVCMSFIFWSHSSMRSIGSVWSQPYLSCQIRCKSMRYLMVTSRRYPKGSHSLETRLRAILFVRPSSMSRVSSPNFMLTVSLSLFQWCPSTSTIFSSGLRSTSGEFEFYTFIENFPPSRILFNGEV